MKKIKFMLLFALLQIASVISIHAEIIKGDCGDNVTFTLDTETKLLEISGVGKISDFGSSNAPWYNVRANIKNVKISNRIKYIGNYAFKDCSELTAINIPDSVTAIGAYAFSGCGKLTAIDVPGSMTIIGRCAFENCIRLADVKLSEGLESIGLYAFDGCEKLTTITIPSSMEKIGEYAFYNCSRLNTVKIPNSVESIGEYAFEGCGKLSTISIPNSVESIGRGAFHNCATLTSITLPNSITAINANTFEGCTNLAEVNIPNSVETIGENAFYGCKQLKSITLPSGMKAITKNAFNGCTGLISIDIPNNITSIEENAFNKCWSLESVNIPSSVTYIGKYAFAYTSLTSINIPNSITTIESYTFTGCTELTSIKIPVNVTKINSGAFSGCKRVKTVTIPSRTELLEVYSFANCDSITDIFLYGESVKTAEDAFSEKTEKNAILHVPASQLEGYKTTEPWSRFNNIVAIKEEEKPTEDTPTNYVFLAESKGAAGKDATLSLMMNNKVMVTGYQCDVYLPAGVTFAKGEDGFEKIELSTKRTTSKDTDYFSYRKQESGAMRILCSSTTNKTFSGNEGEVATMVVHLDKDLTPGEYPVILRNIVLSDPQAQTYRNDEMRAMLTVVDYEVGDANGDKDINVGDFTAIANHIQGVTADKESSVRSLWMYIRNLCMYIQRL